jgi:transcriptional regulator GlxA family with amidase domain
MTQKRVGILIFPDVEVLDFCGPFEVFSVSRLNESKRREEHSPFEVLLIAESSEAISTTGGMRVLPDRTLRNCPPLDILLVPGGWGTRREMSNPRLLTWIKKRAQQVELLASVCTGALILGSTGLLDGHTATTHWKSLDLMSQRFPRVKIDRRRQVVVDGKIITSAGISAGIDLALQIVERYFGKRIAHATARHMEYSFTKNNRRRVQLKAASKAERKKLSKV